MRRGRSFGNRRGFIKVTFVLDVSGDLSGNSCTFVCLLCRQNEAVTNYLRSLRSFLGSFSSFEEQLQLGCQCEDEKMLNISEQLYLEPVTHLEQ